MNEDELAERIFQLEQENEKLKNKLKELGVD